MHVFLIGVVLCNRTVEHNMAMFSELSLACCTLARKAKQRGNNSTDLLTPAVMVDNFTEKIDKCPLNQGR